MWYAILYGLLAIVVIFLGILGYCLMAAASEADDFMDEKMGTSADV